MSANECPNQKHLNNKVKQFTSEIRHKRINCPQDVARQVTVCSLNSQIFSRIKEPCTDRFTMRAPKGQGIFPISRLSEGRKIHVLSCNVDYPDSLSPCSISLRNAWSSRFLSVRQIAQNRKRSKHFSTKTHRNTHDERKRSETHLALRNWRFHGESMRGSLMRERFVS